LTRAAAGAHPRRIVIGNLSTLRRLAHRFAPVVAVLLLITIVIGGAHHHADGVHDVCALCSVAHGSAIAADVPSPVASLSEHPDLLVASAEHTPLPIRLDVPRGRAPPLA
jgi:hypothetical protein